MVVHVTAMGTVYDLSLCRRCLRVCIVFFSFGVMIVIEPQSCSRSFAFVLGVIVVPIFSKAVCVHALKGLALPRASHSGEIRSHRLRSTLAAAPVL